MADDDNVSSIPARPEKNPIDQAINAIKEQQQKAAAAAVKQQYEVTMKAREVFENELTKLNQVSQQTVRDKQRADLIAAAIKSGE